MFTSIYTSSKKKYDVGKYIVLVIRFAVRLIFVLLIKQVLLSSILLLKDRILFVNDLFCTKKLYSKLLRNSVGIFIGSGIC